MCPALPLHAGCSCAAGAGAAQLLCWWRRTRSQRSGGPGGRASRLLSCWKRSRQTRVERRHRSLRDGALTPAAVHHALAACAHVAYFGCPTQMSAWETRKLECAKGSSRGARAAIFILPHIYCEFFLPSLQHELEFVLHRQNIFSPLSRAAVCISPVQIVARSRPYFDSTCGSAALLAARYGRSAALWALLLLTCTYLHASACAFVLPALMPDVASSLVRRPIPFRKYFAFLHFHGSLRPAGPPGARSATPRPNPYCAPPAQQMTDTQSASLTFVFTLTYSLLLIPAGAASHLHKP